MDRQCRPATSIAPALTKPGFCQLWMSTFGHYRNAISLPCFWGGLPLETSPLKSGYQLIQFRRNFARCQDMVNTARGLGAQRHSVYLGRNVLREGCSPCCLYSLATFSSVTVVARKNNANRTRAHGCCQRSKKQVHLRVPSAARGNDLQGSMFYQQICIARNDVDLISPYLHPGCGQCHRHFGMTR